MNVQGTVAGKKSELGIYLEREREIESETERKRKRESDRVNVQGTAAGRNQLPYDT